jgi:hypothetical protein
VTRFNPGNAHVSGLSRHGAYVGSDKLDGDQTKVEGHEVLPRFGPLGRVMTYVLLVRLFIDGVATMEVLQWRRRLDLAESGGL